MGHGEGWDVKASDGRLARLTGCGQGCSGHNVALLADIIVTPATSAPSKVLLTPPRDTGLNYTADVAVPTCPMSS